MQIYELFLVLTRKNVKDFNLFFLCLLFGSYVFILYLCSEQIKPYNMNTSELTKNQWKQLRDFGLIDEGEGNGFASTTKKADDTLRISAYRNTFVKLKGKQNIYIVRYYSGCFYPMWHKLNYMTHEEAEKSNYLNEIITITK